MAWNNPPTWEPNTILTAASLNTYLRDNLNALYQDNHRIRTASGAGNTVLASASTYYNIAMAAGAGSTFFTDSGNGIQNASGRTLHVWVTGQAFWSTNITFTGGGVLRRMALVYDPGVAAFAALRDAYMDPVASGASTVTQLQAMVRMVHGSTITLQAFHNDSASNTIAGTTLTFLRATVCSWEGA